MKTTFFYVIATGLGTGLLPKAPGTWGSLLGLFLSLFIYSLWHEKGLMVLLFITTIGGWISTQHILKTKNFEDPDPSYIVIDEIAGLSLTLLLVHLFIGFIALDMFALSFIFFRLFDIWKPFPISWVEIRLSQQNQTAALGIMIDDLLAAIPAAFITIIMNTFPFNILNFFKYLFS